MISREDAIDNLTITLKGLGSQYIEDYREEIEWAIGDMYDMSIIKKKMLQDQRFETLIWSVLSKGK